MCCKNFPIILFCLLSQTKTAKASTVVDLDSSSTSDLPAEDKLAIKSSVEFIILPLGINVDGKNVLPSALIRGYENGIEAVDFNNWLISFNDVVNALQLKVKELDGELVEIRSPGLVVRVDLQELENDPELGRSISIRQIKELLGVATEFDIADYAVNFAPLWSGSNAAGNRVSSRFQPILTDGLTTIEAPVFSLSAIGQNINFKHRRNSETGESSMSTDGELSALGTIFGNSWYLGIDRENVLKPKQWSIGEFQILRQQKNADYVLGSQPTFWDNQHDGDYWGFTNIQRWGFSLSSASIGNFDVAKRLQTNSIGVEIVGEAEPGTLVQLRQEVSDELLGEILVGSSGVYRFENIDTNKVRSREFQVYLYPNGQLTAEPEIKEADFSTVPGQLIKGASTLVTSIGTNREEEENSLLGNFGDYQGGISYRRGVTKDLTLGTGIVADKTILGLGEIFYQPKKVPLTVAGTALIGTEEGIEFNVNAKYIPSDTLRFNFRADDTSQRANVSWRTTPKLTLDAGANLGEGSFDTRASYSFGSRRFSNSVSLGYDTGQNDWRWNVRSRWNSLQFSQRGNGKNINSDLNYQISPAHRVSLNYDKPLGNEDAGDFTVVNWSYVPQSSDRNKKSKLKFDLGYGVGSEGHGLIASATTNVLPGMGIRASYRQITSSSSNDSFRLQISPNFSVQPKLGLGSDRMENLRGKGGLLIQPFLDNNGNGKLDNNEEIYTEDIDLLLMLNNRPIRKSQAQIKKNGVLFQVDPDMYRIDLDPAGYPIDYSPVKDAFAVEVAAGSYTVVPVPFAVSYTVAGTLTDVKDKPVGGATIEAMPTNEGSNRVTSVTNGGGIFYLENLQQGTYEMSINGQPAEPRIMTVDENTEPFSEINFKAGS